MVSNGDWAQGCSINVTFTIHGHKYMAVGTTQPGPMNTTANCQPVTVGTSITVFYDPADPLENSVNFNDGYDGFFLFVAFALCCLVPGVVMIVKNKRAISRLDAETSGVGPPGVTPPLISRPAPPPPLPMVPPPKQPPAGRKP